MDWDEDPLSSREETTTSAQQVLEKVVVPMNSPPSVASSLSSARDQSSEYDTPATSAVATPAESLGKATSSVMTTGRTGKAAKGKRKRSEVDELVEADALLAKSLQEQEYDEDPQVGTKSKTARKAPIEDSDDEVSLLSDVAMGNSPDADDIDDSEEVNATTSRRRKAVPRISLPSRAARDSAKKSLKDRASHQVIDSEDSGLSDHASDESVFLSDIDSDAFHDSEEGDEDLDVARSTNGMTGTNTASALATATQARRQRGGAPSAQARQSWRDRRIQGLVDRVCYCFRPALAPCETH